MPVDFQIYARSQTEKGKAKCGDSFAYVAMNNYVVAAVSDGVGTRPCDWLASKTLCAKFIELVCLKLETNYEPSDLVKICLEVDRLVSNPAPECKGMMAVLSAVVWNTKNNHVDFINVGDSRIYKLTKNNQPIQISSDEVKAVNIRKPNGKLELTNGSTVVRTGLTNAFGLNNVNIKVQTYEFLPGETLFLASDGFYECHSTFDDDLRNIAHSLSLNETTAKVFKFYENYQTDDATLLILRNHQLGITLPEIYNIQYTDIKDHCAKFQCTELMYEKLKHTMLKKNRTEALATLAIMETAYLIPSKAMLDALIETMKTENFTDGAVFAGIVRLIREAMK